MIQLNRPKYHPESYENVKRVMNDGWTGLGREVNLFEEELASYLGARYVVGLNSGTEALRLAINMANLPPNAIVVSTPNTFVSTNHVILQSHYSIMFADIDPKTGSLSIKDTKTLLKRLKGLNYPVKGIMVVHYGGMPVEIDAFKELADYYKCTLFEDCAHACGAIYNDRMVGSTGRFNCFSFHAVKNLSLGDGGALVTDDEDIYKLAKKLRWLGIDQSTADRTLGDKYTWDYDVSSLGYKSHMNNIQAAIGRGQLLHLDEDNAYRAKMVDRYKSHLLFERGIELMKGPETGVSSNHLFVVRFLSSYDREKVMTALKNADIQYGYHYKPNYNYPMYRGTKWANYPGMDEFYSTALSLPMHLFLTEKDVDYICEVISGALKNE